MTQIIVSLIQALADKLPETTPKPILTLKTTFDHLLNESAQLVGAERGVILLVDQQGRLTVGLTHNSTVLHEPHLVDIGHEALQAKQPILTTNGDHNEHSATDLDQNLPTFKLRTVISYPVLYDGNVAVVLYLDKRVSTGLYTEKHLSLLEESVGKIEEAIHQADSATS